MWWTNLQVLLVIVSRDCWLCQLSIGKLAWSKLEPFVRISLTGIQQNLYVGHLDTSLQIGGVNHKTRNTSLGMFYNNCSTLCQSVYRNCTDLVILYLNVHKCWLIFWQHAYWLKFNNTTIASISPKNGRVLNSSTYCGTDPQSCGAAPSKSGTGTVVTNSVLMLF